jgi:hypothetical protein
MPYFYHEILFEYFICHVTFIDTTLALEELALDFNFISFDGIQ